MCKQALICILVMVTRVMILFGGRSLDRLQSIFMVGRFHSASIMEVEIALSVNHLIDMVLAHTTSGSPFTPVIEVSE